MAFTVKTEPMEHQQLSMTIEVDEARIQDEMRKVARKVSRTVDIPGFRKGRVPHHVLVQFLGRDTVISEFANELGQELYQEAVTQEKLNPYTTAKIDDIDFGPPVRFHLTVPLYPQVTLGAYRSIRMEEEEVKLDEKQVQARLRKLLEEHSDYREVEWESEYGNLMTIDIRGVVLDEEGRETDEIVFDEKGWDVTLDDANPMEPEGLDEALLDLVAGTEKSFSLTWPTDSPSMHAGKTVHFAVKVHKVQSYQPPELSDEIAQMMGPDYETAAELLDDLRETILAEAKAEAEEYYLEKVLDAICEISEFDYPPAAIEMHVDQIVQKNEAQLQQMGLTGTEQYLEMTNKSMEEYRATLREDAETILQRALIMMRVVEEEHLEVSDEEYEEFMQTVSGPIQEEAEEQDRQAEIQKMMREESTRAYLDQELLKEKAITRILEIARGAELPELPPDTEPEDTSAAEVEQGKHETASQTVP